MPEKRKISFDARRNRVKIESIRTEEFDAKEIKKQYESLKNTRVNLEGQSKSLKEQIKALNDKETEEVKKLRELIKTVNNLDKKEQLVAKKKGIDEALIAYKKDLHFLNQIIPRLPKK